MSLMLMLVIRVLLYKGFCFFMEVRVTMANSSQQLELITQLCKARRLDVEDTFVIAKKLLENFRSAIWMQGGLSDAARSILMGERKREVKQWYINLKKLTREELRDASINSAIFHIYRTDWILKAVDVVLEKVKEFYPSGEVYYNILAKAYFDEEDKKDLEVAEELALDRSTYYRRKKEAILLCGMLLWEEAREREFV